MIFRYLLVGGTAASVDIAFFIIFSYYLGFNYLVVGAIGFIIATAVNYFLSIRYVFKSTVRFTKKNEISAIYLVSGAGLLFHEIVLAIGVEHLILPLIGAKLLATGSVFFWNYLLRKHYVFKEKESIETI